MRASALPRALSSRLLLVVGAEDPAARRAALHACALGARLVLAGTTTRGVLETAGLAASSGGVARVIEEASPPLLGAALLDAAAAALGAPTDVLVADGVVPHAADAARALDALLPAPHVCLVVPARPPGGERAHAERVADALAEIAGRRDAARVSPDEPPRGGAS